MAARKRGGSRPSKVPVWNHRFQRAVDTVHRMEQVEDSEGADGRVAQRLLKGYKRLSTLCQDFVATALMYVRRAWQLRDEHALLSTPTHTLHCIP